MEYRTLGRSGCAVSTLALGTMTFGAETDERTAHAQLDRYLEAGGNLVDTADVYSAGASEEIVGRWLAARPQEVRRQVVLATKGRFPMGPGPNDVGLSRRHLALALDDSLRRLGVDTIDLYQVHAHDPFTPIEETLRFLDDAARAGRDPLRRPVQFCRLAVAKGRRCGRCPPLGPAGDPPAAVQPSGPGDRVGDRARVPGGRPRPVAMVAARRGLADRQVPHDELPTGATRLGEDPGRGVEAYDRRSRLDRTWDVIAAVGRIAQARGTTMAQVALAWLVDRPTVTSVILGARTVAQLEDNLGAAGLHLSPAETEALDSASDPDAADYPYGGPGGQQRSRNIAGGR